MKLIDLLVQELPKRGGWPEGAVECEHFVDEANIDFYDKYGNWPEDCAKKYGSRFAQKCVQQRVPGSGVKKETVTREEYEKALASSKMSGWDGEGLPPVGCECELYDCEQWNPVRIKYVGEKYVVTDRTDLGYEVVYCLAEKPERFRPIRTESERKRDESVQALSDFFGHAAGLYNLLGLYDAIAAGKIPHITLK